MVVGTQMKNQNWLLLLSLIGVAVIIHQFAPAERVYEFTVTADQAWQDTGIELRPGQQLLIEYVSGQAVDADTTIWDGTGAGFACSHAGCCEPLPGAPRSSLIGRVGSIDEGIFYIGNGVKNGVASEGNLYLRLNDCNAGLFDNSGSFLVRITTK
jgi:hypothetical protein